MAERSRERDWTRMFHVHRIDGRGVVVPRISLVNYSFAYHFVISAKHFDFFLSRVLLFFSPDQNGWPIGDSHQKLSQVSSSKTKKTKKKKVKVVPFLMGRTPRPFSRWQLTLGVTYEKTDHGPSSQKKNKFFHWMEFPPFRHVPIQRPCVCPYDGWFCRVFDGIDYFLPTRRDFLLPCIYFNSGFIIRDGAKNTSCHARGTRGCVFYFFILFFGDAGAEKNKKFSLFFFLVVVVWLKKKFCWSRDLLVLNEFCLLFLFSSFTLSSFFFHIKFPFDWSSSEETRERDGATRVGRWCGRAFNPERKSFFGGFDGWWLEARGTSIRRRRGWK